jgi:hypothetical protein
MAGLKTCTFWRPITARRRRRMSSSVLPENIGPQITSIEPASRRDESMRASVAAARREANYVGRRETEGPSRRAWLRARWRSSRAPAARP